MTAGDTSNEDTFPRVGFETEMSIKSLVDSVQISALDGSGDFLESSAVFEVKDTCN